MSNRTSRANSWESAIPKPVATPAVELEKVQQHVARLTRRIEQQVKHLEGLTDYPELSKRASDVLARVASRAHSAGKHEEAGGAREERKEYLNSLAAQTGEVLSTSGSGKYSWGAQDYTECQ